MWAGKAIVAWAIAAFAISLPQPSSDATQGSGAIAGRVVDATTQRPLRGVVVTVEAIDAATPRGSARTGLLTGADGAFAARNLAAGSYLISAFAPGYFESGSGQRRVKGTRVPIDLDEGQRIQNVSIAIWPQGSIAGRVTDDQGVPLGHVAVRVDSATPATAERPAIGFTATTSETGEYFIAGIVPGTYLVAVAPLYGTRTLGAPQADAARMPVVRYALTGSLTADSRYEITIAGVPLLPPGADGRPRVYPATFAPDRRSATDAPTIVLAAGESRTQVDLVLRPVSGFTVAGRVNGPNGPAAGWLVRVTPRGCDSRWTIATSSTSPDGSFVFTNVPAGDYAIEALSPPPALVSNGDPDGFHASTAIALDRDRSDVALTMRAGVRVSGRFVFDADFPAAALSKLAAYLDPIAGDEYAVPPGSPQRATGDTFALTGVQPGRFFASVAGLPEGWMLESATSAGRTLAFSPLEVGSTDITDLEFRITKRVTAIAGSVTNPGGSPTSAASVVVFPADRAAWLFGTRGIHQIRTMRATSDYEFTALPPGTYLVVAVDDGAMEGWPQASMLAAWAPRGTRVTLGPGDRQRVDLTVQPR